MTGPYTADELAHLMLMRDPALWDLGRAIETIAAQLDDISFLETLCGARDDADRALLRVTPPPGPALSRPPCAACGHESARHKHHMGDICIGCPCMRYVAPTEPGPRAVSTEGLML